MADTNRPPRTLRHLETPKRCHPGATTRRRNDATTQFCTVWNGDMMAGEKTVRDGGGKLVTYGEANECAQTGLSCQLDADPVNTMCCGQRERSMMESLTVWLGVVGGAGGLILSAMKLLPL